MTKEQKIALIWEQLQSEEIREKVWKDYGVPARQMLAFLCGFALAGIMFILINQRVAGWELIGYLLALCTLLAIIGIVIGFFYIRSKHG